MKLKVFHKNVMKVMEIKMEDLKIDVLKNELEKKLCV
jgi:hypothetical protein